MLTPLPDEDSAFIIRDPRGLDTSAVPSGFAQSSEDRSPQSVASRPFHFFRSYCMDCSEGSASGNGTDARTSTADECGQEMVPWVWMSVRAIPPEPVAIQGSAQAATAPDAEDPLGEAPEAPATSPYDGNGTTGPAPDELGHVARPNADPRRPVNTPDRLRRLLHVPERRPTAPRPRPAPLYRYAVHMGCGIYPREYTVFRSPNYLTGQPLTMDERLELAELSEEQRPAVTARQLRTCDLRVVRGAEMKALGEKGQVMQNCAESCLVS